jgi:hypothetical protein
LPVHIPLVSIEYTPDTHATHLITSGSSSKAGVTVCDANDGCCSTDGVALKDANEAGFWT